jgi:hypothetical protein
LIGSGGAAEDWKWRRAEAVVLAGFLKVRRVGVPGGQDATMRNADQALPDKLSCLPWATIALWMDEVNSAERPLDFGTTLPDTGLPMIIAVKGAAAA